METEKVLEAIQRLEQNLRKDMNQRFDIMDKKFDDVYSRFDTVDKKFDDVNARLDLAEEHAKKTDKKIDVMTQMIVKNSEDIQSLKSDHGHYTGKFDTLNGLVGKENWIIKTDIQRIKQTIGINN